MSVLKSAGYFRRKHSKDPESSHRPETEERVSSLTDKCIRSRTGSKFYENIVNVRFGCSDIHLKVYIFLLEMKLPNDKYTKYLKSRWLTLEHECLHDQLSLCYLVRKVWFPFRLLWLQPQPTICWVNKASFKMLREDKHTLCDKEIKMEVTSFSKCLINLQPLALVLRTTADTLYILH